MNDTTLATIFEHNNWANLQIVRACSALSEEQLNATPDRLSTWSVREALVHLVEAQNGYLSLLTNRRDNSPNGTSSFAELEASVVQSGESLLAIARDNVSDRHRDRIRSSDGFEIEPWVVMVQTINHANDHRRQLCGMLRALNMIPPRLDGWAFGEVVDAVIPPSQ